MVVTRGGADAGVDNLGGLSLRKSFGQARERVELGRIVD
jgi:hypothetical protein